MADLFATLDDACASPKGDCAGRTHFVVHQTVAGNYTYDTIKEWIGVKRNKSHAVILKTGEIVHLWPFKEAQVWATKAESGIQPINGTLPNFALKGKCINIEIDYEDKGAANAQQYVSLAALYIAACMTVKRVLIIVPHIEVDRGIDDGHSDPQSFDYNRFYEILKFHGIDMARVPRFDHDRYWKKDSYKTPWDTDWYQWPPILTGDPHAKPKSAAKKSANG